MTLTSKFTFLKAVLLAALFVTTISASSDVAAAFDIGAVQPSACGVAGGNVFLSTSNVLSTVSTSRVFEGCWTYFPSGPCRAIYRKNQSYSICGECDDFGNPGSGGCSSISLQTLNSGYWCS